MTHRTDTAEPLPGSWAALRRFARRRAVVQQCELCGSEVAPEHPHLIEPATRKLHCTCDACAILFSHEAQTKYRRVSRRLRYLADFRLSDVEWNALQIPINLAFFVRTSAGGKVMAVYPSPAGPTESLLDLDSWDEIVRENPLLDQLEPDTEALLVNRVGTTREHFLAPIDECYRLVGLLRSNWQGISGGVRVWEAVHGFFQELKQRSC